MHTKIDKVVPVPKTINAPLNPRNDNGGCFETPSGFRQRRTSLVNDFLIQNWNSPASRISIKLNYLNLLKITLVSVRIISFLKNSTNSRNFDTFNRSYLFLKMSASGLSFARPRAATLVFQKISYPIVKSHRLFFFKSLPTMLWILSVAYYK